MRRVSLVVVATRMGEMNSSNSIACIVFMIVSSIYT